LTERELAELDKLISGEIWVPLPGPQTAAYYTEADELFYGGAAGGGKSDLLLGLTLTAHLKSIIFRRESTQLQGIFDRLFVELLKSRQGFNGQANIWRGLGRQIEFGSCKNVGDEQKYQGRPHDLIGIDEVTHFHEIQYRFLCGWLRTTVEGQRCRVVATGNPPTDSDGEWVISHWAPWLDNKHPNPAKPGELRWYAMVDGQEIEVENGDAIEVDGEIVKPRSRTFIPSSVEDNPFLMGTGYKATLQSLPEPLRSQMLKGDFLAGIGDDPWQIIPTAWVEAAMARWSPDGKRRQMDSVGVDPARGGKDNTCISTRYGTWFDEPARYPGTETPDGPVVASLVVAKTRDRAPIHVDVIGIGSSVYDHLKGINIHVVPVNNAEGTDRMDRANIIKMRNVRAADYWEMREALDPDNGDNLALPPDSQLKADLCAPRWSLTAGGILVEDKEQIKKRIGRSTDDGDACVMANRKTIKKNISIKIPGTSAAARKPMI
jgi:hypothetical protein